MNYKERLKSLRIHTQRFAGLTLLNRALMSTNWTEDAQLIMTLCIGCKFNTDKIIKLQYGNWRIFYNKLNSCVISKVLGFC